MKVDWLIGVLEMDPSALGVMRENDINTIVEAAREVEEFNGMERMVASQLIRGGLSEEFYKFLVFRFIFRACDRKCRSCNNLMYDAFEYSNVSMSAWDDPSAWLSGAGLWDPMVRVDYITSYMNTGRVFCREPRIIEDVITRIHNKNIRKKFYKKWGLVDEG